MLTRLRKFIIPVNERKYYSENTEEIDINYEIKNNKIILYLDFSLYKYDLYGKELNVKLNKKVYVKKNNPLNDEKKLYNEEFIIDGHSKKIIINLNDDDLTYVGSKIDINLDLELKINDSIFFDTKIKYKVVNNIKNKDLTFSHFDNVYRSIDRYNLWSNFLVLGFFQKISILVLLGLNLYVYISVFLIGISFSLGIGIFYVAFLKKNIFGSYLKVGFFNKVNLKSINSKYKIKDFVFGKSSIDLTNLRIRVVAANIEKGQYNSGSGKNRSTNNILNPVNGIVLYNEVIPFVKKNTYFLDYLKKDFSFEKAYEKLLPKIIISDTHGLDLEWKIQFIHDKYVDLELIGEKKFLNF